VIKWGNLDVLTKATHTLRERVKLWDKSSPIRIILERNIGLLRSELDRRKSPA
jgi:hypothetical protein